MAFVAFVAKTAPVRVVAAVTCNTTGWRFFAKWGRPVATFAFNRTVLVQERKMCIPVMPKRRAFPVGFVMTLFAGRSVGSLVDVVLAVATNAVARGVGVSLVTVAIAALRVGVRELQGETGLVVVEASVLPCRFGMAAATLFPQAAFVLVIYAVAVHTFGGRSAPGLSVAVATAA